MLIKLYFFQKYSRQPSADSNYFKDAWGVNCNFETECAWVSNDSFRVVTGHELVENNLTGLISGPTADSSRDANGHFLHVFLFPDSTSQTLKSPSYTSTMDTCTLELFLHQSNMKNGRFRIVIESVKEPNNTWVSHEMTGNDFRMWENYTFLINQITQEFRILFEIEPNGLNEQLRGHVSIDNLQMRNCFPDRSQKSDCDDSNIICNRSRTEVCIPSSRICDIEAWCDDNEDELKNCGKLFESC